MKTTGTTALMLALHARVEELEAMLESVGAGGVSAQRVTQADTLDEATDHRRRYRGSKGE